MWTKKTTTRVKAAASLFLSLVLLSAATAQAQSPAAFHLKAGDRVVFFGDSITEQRLYTTFVETFVLTRMPTLPVTFVHSGWGGDKVSGGGGGAIDTRLRRDVFAHDPNVVTVMLGMNDGRYQPFDQAVFDDFAEGYEHIVASLKTTLPRARVTLIQPSPYDDVTRPPMAGGSYNDVLLRYGAFIKKVAARERFAFADLNTDLVDVLRRATKTDAEVAQQFIKDRVHPGPAGSIIMAASLLKAWHAPGLVSSVEVDAAQKRIVQARNTKVSNVAAAPLGEGASWVQLDAALPMPVDTGDAALALAIKSSSFTDTLNRQPLRVTGLHGGSFALWIDDQQVGVFRGPDLAKGINLATLPTPMLRQAAEVHALTLKHNEIHATRWRQVELRMGKDSDDSVSAALKALDGLEAALVAKQRAAAAPRSRRFDLVPVSDDAAAVPAGFQPLFGEGALRYILLAAKPQRNVEVFLEMDGDGDAPGLLLLRANERGQGFTVTLDGRARGALGRVEGVGFKGAGRTAAPDWAPHWKKDAWNAVRVRISGENAHIVVWLNGTKLTDWTAGSVQPPADGGWDRVAVRVPQDGRPPHFRNVAVKDLP